MITLFLNIRFASQRAATALCLLSASTSLSLIIAGRDKIMLSGASLSLIIAHSNAIIQQKTSAKTVPLNPAAYLQLIWSCVPVKQETKQHEISSVSGGCSAIPVSFNQQLAMRGSKYFPSNLREATAYEHHQRCKSNIPSWRKLTIKGS
ncbi:hypothetical protein M514_16146 [Trichuris suis]|uniref:Uncharacterized protein n=1 Tax=Trichuris suis TaxID=68888 RepID=A0A085NQ80_9BILA|nr:hypothetical protein M514_16146 [Trichuris suis]